jgi:Flp pilus assembly pilin Flp
MFGHRFWSDESGVSLTEYLLLLGVMTGAVIGSVAYFSSDLGAVTTTPTNFYSAGAAQAVVAPESTSGSSSSSSGGSSSSSGGSSSGGSSSSSSSGGSSSGGDGGSSGGDGGSSSGGGDDHSPYTAKITVTKNGKYGTYVDENGRTKTIKCSDYKGKKCPSTYTAKS